MLAAMFDALARLCGRRAGAVVLTWTALVAAGLATAVGGVLGDTVFDRLTSGALVVPGEAQDGLDLLLRAADDGPVVQLVLDGVDPHTYLAGTQLRYDAPDADRAVDSARADLLAMPGVIRVEDPFAGRPGVFAARDLAFVADAQRAVLVRVTLRRDLPEEQQHELIERVTDRLHAIGAEVPGSRPLVGGVEGLTEEIVDQVEADLTTGEVVAVPISAAVMVVVFGGFLAAGLPLAGALASVSGGLAGLLGWSYLIDLDPSVINVVTGLSLGLCIDYGLLLVSRYREEARRILAATPGREAGRHVTLTPDERELALRRTLASAGRTVTFSGITVAVALTGLLCFRTPLLQAVGAAGISAITVALLAALTLVPGLIMLTGDRVLRPGLVHRLPGLGSLLRRLGDTAPAEGVFSRLARVVQRSPTTTAMTALGVLAVLVVMAMPALRLDLVSSGGGMLPPQSEQRQLFERMTADFRFASIPPVFVVVEQPAERVDGLVRQLRAVPGVTAVDEPLPQRQGPTPVTVIGVRVPYGESSPGMADVVEDLRRLDPGYPTWVSGQPAITVDYLADIRRNAPLAVGVVALATFVLLFLMTGSVLVPLKALLMNVVSLGACLGVLVWVFQDGWLEGFAGLRPAGGVETFIAPIVLAFSFGLAMDYEVFLLARIAEARRLGLSNDEAVVVGLQRSGRIITSAALILVVVFVGLLAGQLLLVKELGTALIVAVVIDVTLVRLLLVPATMTLLGEWNWWAPAPLRRLHARLGLREDADVAEPPAPAPATAPAGATLSP
jgi:RND superfamily putative drug exporter